jgi:serine/threonine protein kinase
MAPEVLKGKYTKQADLWSVGVIAYMLMSSQMPFYGRARSDIVDQIMIGYVFVSTSRMLDFFNGETVRQMISIGLLF